MDIPENVIMPFDLYQHREGIKENKLDRIWRNYLEKLPPKLKKEAEALGWELIDNSFIEEDGIARYRIMQAKGGSEKLNKYIIEHCHPYIVEMKEN